MRINSSKPGSGFTLLESFNFEDVSYVLGMLGNVELAAVTKDDIYNIQDRVVKSGLAPLHIVVGKYSETDEDTDSVEQQGPSSQNPVQVLLYVEQSGRLTVLDPTMINTTNLKTHILFSVKAPLPTQEPTYR